MKWGKIETDLIETKNVTFHIISNILKNYEFFDIRLLLKGIIDINVPKFVSGDMLLYKGIIQDLFPDVKPPQIERKPIIKTFEERCKKNSLQATPWFSEKVIYVNSLIA